MDSYTPVPTSFEEIRKRLDPSYSYIIFEKQPDSGGCDEFWEIIPFLERLKKEDLVQEVHFDRESKKCFLVVKTGPEETDRIIQEFLDLKMPKHILCFIYDSRHRG